MAEQRSEKRKRRGQELAIHTDGFPVGRCGNGPLALQIAIGLFSGYYGNVPEAKPKRVFKRPAPMGGQINATVCIWVSSQCVPALPINSLNNFIFELPTVCDGHIYPRNRRSLGHLRQKFAG